MERSTMPATQHDDYSLISKIKRQLSKRRSCSPALPASPRQSQTYPPATEASPQTSRMPPQVEPFCYRAMLIQYPNVPAQLPPRASLLGVPAEIRLQIYSYLFSPPPLLPADVSKQREADQRQQTSYRLAVIQADDGLTPGIELLTICRQIYHEALPFLHRSILIVPQQRPYTVNRKLAIKTERSLPLDRTRLGRVDAAAFHSLRVRELVIRDWIQDLPTTIDAEKWELGRSVRRVPVQVDTVYLQLCICRGANHPIPSTPEFARGYAGQIAGGVMAVFLSVTAVRRVVVYFCGTKGTRHILIEHADLIVDAMKKMFDEIVMERRRESERDIWWTDTFKKDDVARYVMTFPEFEGRQEGKVAIEFYDSFAETGKTCVLA